MIVRLGVISAGQASVQGVIVAGHLPRIIRARRVASISITRLTRRSAAALGRVPGHDQDGNQHAAEERRDGRRYDPPPAQTGKNQRFHV